MGFWDIGASSLLGAAGSVAGGLLSGGGGGHSAQYYADLQTKQFDYQFNKNYQAQKEFAKNGIRWKVDDAKAAGLHPLAALGSGSFFSPVASAGGGAVGDATAGQDYSWLADAGQSIGRAVEAGMTKEERAKAEAINDEVTSLKLENMRLQNESIKLEMASQLARDVTASQRAVRSTALPPGTPSLRTRADGATVGTVMPGQGDASTSSLFTVKPAELVASHPDTPFAEAGSHPEVKWTRTALGGYASARSAALEEALEDDTLGSFRYNLRNGLGAAVSDQRFAPPRAYLPDGGRDNRWMWLYDNVNGDWFPYHTSQPRSKALMGIFGIGR